MKTQDILTKVEEYYKLDLEYLEVEYNEMPVKIRMNKNHGRNHGRNDDNSVNNLSLVSDYAKGINQDSYFEHETKAIIYVQKQVFGIRDWEDAKTAIIDFLSDIDYAN